MRYVQRDKDGKVVGHFACPQPYAQEELADDHPEVLAFDAPPVRPPPRKSDVDALRELLVEKQIVTQAEIDAKRAEFARPLRRNLTK